MPIGLWIAVLLLLPTVTQAQSGDGDTDTEPRISCTSHITMNESSLTCKLVGGRSDNEDDEDDNEGDGIKRMTMCYTDWSVNSIKCLEEFGDTFTSKDIHPLADFNLTVHLKRGGTVRTTVDLKKIVKPRSPQVWNVTFNQESNLAVFHIRTPYLNDYLRIENQRFQLHIWTAGSETTQDTIESDTLDINMEHLEKNRKYHVKVRAIPCKHLQGSWSEWSETFRFSTPAEEKIPQQKTDDRRETIYKLIMCLVLLMVVTFSVVFFWKNKIFTYMWPNIPHPKHTLVQICKPNKGLLLNFKPEVFSALKISQIEKISCEETEPSIPAAAVAADGTQSNTSTQSSDCSRSNDSISTEELELLSRSSSDGDDSLQSSGPSTLDVLRFTEQPRTPAPERSAGQNEAEVFAVSPQEEAYVTMSSFYQIN
ncbi:hypothetical protein PAMP_012840 [Pampus punctatissimus]